MTLLPSLRAASALALLSSAAVLAQQTTTQGGGRPLSTEQRLLQQQTKTHVAAQYAAQGGGGGGGKFAEQVYQGLEAGTGSFPFHVKLFVVTGAAATDDPSRPYSSMLFCSGALIAPDAVLTSADCATFLDVPGLSPGLAASSVYVSAGTSTEQTADRRFEQRRWAESWTLLGGFNVSAASVGTPGLAVLKVSQPFNLTDPNVETIPLATSAVPPSTATFVGIGCTEQQNATAAAPVVSCPNACDPFRFQTRYATEGVLTSQQAAAALSYLGIAGGVRSDSIYTKDLFCWYDFGSPAVTRAASGEWQLLGIFAGAGPWAVAKPGSVVAGPTNTGCGDSLAANQVVSAVYYAANITAALSSPRMCTAAMVNGTWKDWDVTVTTDVRGSQQHAYVAYCAVLPSPLIAPTNEIWVTLPPGFEVNRTRPVVADVQGVQSDPDAVVYDAAKGAVQLRWNANIQPTTAHRSVSFRVAAAYPNDCQGGAHSLAFQSCAVVDLFGAGAISARQCNATLPAPLRRETRAFHSGFFLDSPSGCSVCNACAFWMEDPVTQKRLYRCQLEGKLVIRADPALGDCHLRGRPLADSASPVTSCSA